jgi:membrane-bound inhibitor of C-type lysozyme
MKRFVAAPRGRGAGGVSSAVNSSEDAPMRAAMLSVLALSAALAACNRSAETPAPAPAAQAPVAAASTGLPETAAQRAQHWWICGDVQVSTEMRGEMLTLSGPFGERSLMPQPAASGERYADDQGNEFWNKGEEATLKLDWKEVGECTESQSS